MLIRVAGAQPIITAVVVGSRKVEPNKRDLLRAKLNRKVKGLEARVPARSDSARFICDHLVDVFRRTAP